MVTLRSNPFGSETRTRALLTLGMLGESYAREITRVMGASLFGVQSALKSLERDGLVVARSMGRTRVYSLNPRYFALAELKAYVARLAEVERGLRASAEQVRKRPRRTGKPL